MDNINAVILAGGESSRLPFDKSSLKISTCPLIEIVLELLNKIFNNVILVTNNTHKYMNFNVRTFSDIYKGFGPLGGIYTGLLFSSTPQSFFVGCDMPLLKQELIKYMAEVAEDYDIVVPRYNSFLEPLHAIYSRRCLKPIEKLIREGKLYIRGIFGKMKTRFVEKEEILKYDPEFRCFTNLNTPEDIERLKELGIELDVIDNGIINAKW